MGVLMGGRGDLGLDLRNGPNKNPVHVDDAYDRHDFGVETADVVASDIG